MGRAASSPFPFLLSKPIAGHSERSEESKNINSKVAELLLKDFSEY
ncbi:MAG: hypothetical protein KA807_11335 [Prolixibacteraceae bacterium]|nr:hypothetical protein [Prolixibacteraceae bacterium]